MLSIFFDGVSKITYSFFSILFDSPDLSFNFTLYFTGKQGIPYSRREATLFQGLGFFYNLIQKIEILNDIVALFLCKSSAIGSKNAKLLATLGFEMLPEL